MRILLVEDDPDVVDAVSTLLRLRWEDAEIIAAQHGYEALEKLQNGQFDLVLLDLGLPDIDGQQVIKEVRKTRDIPIVVLTARGQELEIVRSLEAGADDYVTKPFSHAELLARIRAVMRRSQAMPASEGPPFVRPGFSMDFGAREVLRHGKAVRLTPQEYSLLYHLVKNAGRVVPHKTLLAKVWGREYAEEVDYLKVHVQRLRAKLEDDPQNPKLILTERGIGYRLADEVPARTPP